jgi:predicted oxidoreductase (fatty acid repression mutant protein)
MAMDFYSAVKNRRTIYSIDNEHVLSDERILEILQNAVKQSPTAFNSQSGRVVLLLGEHHKKLWAITKETLRKIVPEGNFAQTSDKIDSFAAGYGSVLFFEDQKIIEDLQANFALYKDNFPIWSLQSSGMLQYIVWTSLEMEGFGASLQHYNPLIDEDVRKTWDIPQNWKLIGQMPFGRPTATPGEKDHRPLEELLIMFK